MATKPTVPGNLDVLFPDSKSCTQNTTHVLADGHNS